MLFNRSFIGLYILGFRLGELLTAIGFVIAVIYFLSPKRYLKDLYFNDIQFYSLKLIFLSFIIVGLYTEANFASTYTYKSSSYIWTTFFIFRFNNKF